MWEKMKAKFHEFRHNEDGSELMQWAIIIIIVAALALVAYSISDNLSSKLDEAKNKIDGI